MSARVVIRADEVGARYREWSDGVVVWTGGVGHSLPHRRDPARIAADPIVEFFALTDGGEHVTVALDCAGWRYRAVVPGASTDGYKPGDLTFRAVCAFLRDRAASDDVIGRVVSLLPD